MLFAGWYFGGGKQALFAFGFLSIFLLQYNCFTLLCYFPLYSEVYQPYAYMYSLPVRPPSHPSLSFRPHQVITELCAQLPVLYIQQLSSYLCCTWEWTYGAFLVTWMVLSQFFSPSPSPSLLCPHIHSLHLHLCSYPAYRFTCTIFLDSIYMH